MPDVIDKMPPDYLVSAMPSSWADRPWFYVGKTTVRHHVLKYPCLCRLTKSVFANVADFVVPDAGDCTPVQMDVFLTSEGAFFVGRCLSCKRIYWADSP